MRLPAACSHSSSEGHRSTSNSRSNARSRSRTNTREEIMERFEMEEAARKALAAQLKQSAPGIFGKVPVPSQLVAAAAPAREAKPVPAAPPTHDLVSAIAAIDDARLAHERAQVEAARRAADPIEQANARLDSLTF